ncbi:MAG: PEP-CTERM sorting domain-containing protein [Phycisphaerae bacterium]
MSINAKNVVHNSSTLMAKAVIAGAVLAALGLTASAATADNIIYQDFTGAGTPSATIGTLNGATPVIDNYTGSPTWNAGYAWADSGYSNGIANTNGTSRDSAYLPFVPVAGNVYTLSAIMDPYTNGPTGNGSYGSSQSSDWLGLGFLPSTYPAQGTGHSLAFDSTSPTGASPWMVARSSAGTVIGHVHETCGYVGVGNQNGHTYNPPTIGAPLTETIILNTQAANWTVTFLVDGANIGGAGTTYTFSSANPDIAYVGVENAVIDGTISDFTLSTPEPATWGLLAIGGAAGLLLLKRRKAV